MHHMKTKLFIGGIALITAISYLAFAGLKDGWIRHVPVDQFVQNSEMRSAAR